MARAANPHLSALQGPRLYTAASQAHRDGQTALVALTTAAARTRHLGPTRRRVAGAVNDARTQLQRCEGLLDRALTSLEHRRTDLTAAAQRRDQLRAHGGPQVASRATIRAIDNRTAYAKLAVHDGEATVCTTLALLRRVAADTHSLAHHIDTLVDHALARPPAMLHLIRVLLPPGERSNWWREVAATLAETSDPADRGRHLRSYLTAAPRTIYTAWLLNHQRQTRN
jgi:hypothetical protein